MLGIVNRRGQPDRDRVRNMIREGKLRETSGQTEPVWRWTVPYAECVRYAEHGPRKEPS